MNSASFPVSIPPSLLQEGGVGTIQVGEHEVAVNIRKGLTNRVAFLFHGAADRSKRKIPFFQAFLPETSELTQISIADTGLLCADDLAATWYLGHETLPLHQIIPALTQAISETLECPHPIFVGGSSGGFAALLFSYLHPNSVAVVANPQTNLLTYKTKIDVVNAFRERAWPSVATLGDLAEQLPMDLSKLYRKEGNNSIVYLQSAGDRKHLFTQMAPFFSTLEKSSWVNVTLVSGFWGKLGHSNAVPYTEVAKAVRAVCKSDIVSSDDFLQSDFFAMPSAQGADKADRVTNRFD